MVYAPNENIVLKCVSCGREFSSDSVIFRCSCGGLLEIVFRELPSVSWDVFRSRPFRLWRYREFIPVPDGVNVVSMGEGGTPLVPLDDSALVTGLEKIYVKLEGLNPTGSFKDRGMTVAVSMAKAMGFRIVACASTGNTAASMAAYAARAGLKAITVLPKGKVAAGKLSQVVLHGGIVIKIEGNFDDALKAVLTATESGLVYPLNSINPWRLEGQKTIAYEIADEIGVPDWVVVPVGNAGNISAIWKGFKEMLDAGLIDSLPKMAGVQARGANPITEAYKSGLDKPAFKDNPETLATAIRIGRPVNWMKAFKVLRESNGVMTDVSDEEILEAQRLLARKWGIGVEPASAASIAGIRRLSDEGLIDRNERVVAVLTGHALKDPESMSFHPYTEIEFSDVESVVDAIRKLSREV